MPRLTWAQAAGIVEEELLAEHCRFDSSSAPSHDNLRSDGLRLSWWQTSGSIDEDPKTPRNRALLRAYVRIASGDDPSHPAPLYADGLRLDRGKSIHMDRSVMARLLKAGLVTFDASRPNAPEFKLTDAGRTFIGR